MWAKSDLGRPFGQWGASQSGALTTACPLPPHPPTPPTHTPQPPTALFCGRAYNSLSPSELQSGPPTYPTERHFYLASSFFSSPTTHTSPLPPLFSFFLPILKKESVGYVGGALHKSLVQRELHPLPQIFGVGGCGRFVGGVGGVWGSRSGGVKADAPPVGGEG